MLEGKYIIVYFGKKKNVVQVKNVLYVLMDGNNAVLHTIDGKEFKVRKTFSEIKDELGEGFITIHRGGLVSVMAVSEITDKIYLINGESLTYTHRKRKLIIENFKEESEKIVNGIKNDNSPVTYDDYRRRYESFEKMPFAFTDIELVFDEEKRVTDWIFRYGNEALARLEKMSLDNLINHSFSQVFHNAEKKWLVAYERAAFYGETLELSEYSREIDEELRVICFPTLKGHCGCILFSDKDIKTVKLTENAAEYEHHE